MRLDEVELLHVRVPLVAPFVAGRGSSTVTQAHTVTQTHKEAVLVHVRAAGGVDGWGECAAEPEPTYAPEHIGGVWVTLRDHLVPRLLAGRGFLDVVGNHMAKAACEMALLDATLRRDGVSLAAHLGGTRPAVPAGVVVGLAADPAEAAAAAAARCAEGYRRIKLKIVPGRDVDFARAVRAAIGTDVPLWADANGSYTMADCDRLHRLDVDLIEQPLRPGDLLGHAELSARLDVPVCLDESLASVDDLALALHVGALDVATVKPGRVGGLAAATAFHDRCVAADVPLWCGGMLETGIGRAANVALASLPGFTLPGDLSASNRYFADDLTEPFTLDDDGCLAVPTGAGLGVTVDLARIDAAALRRERIVNR